jgi:cytochrome d ubiquinol oxidase subunit II
MTADKVWPVLLVVAVVFLIYTAFATKLYDNYLNNPALLVVPLIAVAALNAIRVFSAKGKLLRAFAASCVTIVAVVGTGVIGLFPNLILQHGSGIQPHHLQFFIEPVYPGRS